ncbi:zinc finger, CCHC-type containing protein [Tanacetum coccineum]
MVRFARNLHVFVGGHQFLTDFIILENINEFVEKGLTEVLFGQPFKEHVGILEDWVKGVLWFKIKDDKTIFNMPRVEERFGMSSNDAFNRIGSLQQINMTGDQSDYLWELWMAVLTSTTMKRGLLDSTGALTALTLMSNASTFMKGTSLPTGRIRCGYLSLLLTNGVILRYEDISNGTLNILAASSILTSRNTCPLKRSSFLLMSSMLLHIGDGGEGWGTGTGVEGEREGKGGREGGGGEEGWGMEGIGAGEEKEGRRGWGVERRSGFCYVYLLHAKDEALDKFRISKTEVELQQNDLIKTLHTNRGGEYYDPVFFQSIGIIHETTAPYTPQQNGVAERKNKALKEMVNSMAVVRLPNPKRKTLGEKGIDCIFVGYAEHSKAYRFYVFEPNDSVSINSIIESKDAIFDENRFFSIPIPKDIIPNLDESQRDDHSDDVIF